MKNEVINYKGYIISTEEGTKRGIFFRNPLQKVEFSTYCEDSDFSAWKYLDDIKNPLRKVYEILIGNKDIVLNIKKWSKTMNWAGFTANVLCSPVYFEKEYRKLRAISGGKNNIQDIKSYGFESPFNMCAGACDIEFTIIKLKNGKVLRLKRTGTYHFTYRHIIKDIIDTGHLK